MDLQNKHGNMYMVFFILRQKRYKLINNRSKMQITKQFIILFLYIVLIEDYIAFNECQ